MKSALSITIWSLSLLSFICTPLVGEEGKVINVSPLNEVVIEYGDISRSALSLYYGRAIYHYEGVLDFRVLVVGGITIIPSSSYPTVPMGLAIRTGDGLKSGLKLELSSMIAFGGKLEKRRQGYNQYRQNVIDFPITAGLLFETSSFLYRFRLGWVLNTAKGEELVAGVSLGVRF